ncbi:serine hydrolase domain-containing protein [Gordonia sp. (in: high G+C Gram-positive bacteria)]|uniref:serine hydrolase domain-containing protein n=1 Tax=Gordonia sp. (in: high G+C Gram-positive bacteria) TaxID=84139 RepID=UPI0035B3C443
MSSAGPVRSDRLAEEVTPILTARTEGAPRVPGVVAGVTTDEETVFLGAAGVRALDEEQRMTVDSVFALFSATKAVTATVALQLVEEGALDLHAPARTYVPALGELQVIEGFDDDGRPRLRPPASDVTTHQLLTHTAGFGYDFFNENYRRLTADHGVPAVATATRASLRTPLLFDPGTEWEYGSGVDWAGQVIEAVTGRRLREVMAERVLDPLGMSDTGFALPDDARRRRAVLHMRKRGELVPNHRWEQPADPEIDMGGQGLWSTVPDYLTFLRMWLREGRSDRGQQILRPETVTTALRNQIGDLAVRRLPGVIPPLSHDVEFDPGTPKSWSYPFMVNDTDTPTGRKAGSQSWAGLANLYYWIDPHTRIGGFWATQIFPFVDPASIDGYRDFEAATYRALVD